MLTPYPTPTPSTPDPTTPGNSPAPTALGNAVTTALAGTPLAICTVWALETWGTVHGKPLVLDSTTATVVGGLGAATIGYLVQVLRGILQVMLEKVGAPLK